MNLQSALVSLSSSNVAKNLNVLLILQKSQIPATITECSSSYESSDTERYEVIENEESDEVSGYNRSIIMYIQETNVAS